MLVFVTYFTSAVADASKLIVHFDWLLSYCIISFSLASKVDPQACVPFGIGLTSRYLCPFATAGKDAWPISIQSHYLMDREMGFDYFYDSLKSGKRENTWDIPEYVSAFDRLAELGKRGAFGDDVLSLGYGDAGNLFYTEQAAMYLQGSWEINGISDLDIADWVFGCERGIAVMSYG